MPAELDDLLAWCFYPYKNSYGYFTSLHNGLDLAGGYLYDNDYQRAGNSLIYAADQSLNLRETMTTYYAAWSFRLLDVLYWIADNWPSAQPPPEITMANIISAMFSASNEELRDFIGLTDAYRQSLWNKPFNREYWAAIARGFEIWE